MKFYWYSSIWWFDMPMHFLGGFWVGLLFLLMFPLRNFSTKQIFEAIFGVLFIGILWEIFEIVVNDYTIQMPFNTLDTVSDICFDLAGSIFSVLYFYKRIMLKDENKL